MRMRRGAVAIVLAVAALGAACGDDGASTSPFGGDGADDSGSSGQSADVSPDATTASDDAASDDAASGDTASGPGGPDNITPEPAGEVAMNTFRIGSVVWERTLPMTSGQCFLYEDDGTLPDSATVWGSANGDDDIHFSVSYRQDGTFGAQVDNDDDGYFWVAGSQNGTVDDLTIELDFENLIVTGSGVFTNAFNGEWASGSFAFQCEPEDQ